MIPPPGARCAGCLSPLTDPERLGARHTCPEALVLQEKLRAEVWATLAAQNRPRPPIIHRGLQAELRAHRRAARWSPRDLVELGADVIADALSTLIAAAARA